MFLYSVYSIFFYFLSVKFYLLHKPSPRPRVIRWFRPLLQTAVPVVCLSCEGWSGWSNAEEIDSSKPCVFAMVFVWRILPNLSRRCAGRFSWHEMEKPTAHIKGSGTVSLQKSQCKREGRPTNYGDPYLGDFLLRTTLQMPRSKIMERHLGVI